MKVFKLNTGDNAYPKFFPNDINSVVDLIFKQKAINVPRSDPNRLHRCAILYHFVNRLNKFPNIDLHELTTDTKHWFKSMPMYLAMQREIDEFNLKRADKQKDKKDKKAKRKKRKRRIKMKMKK